MEDVYGGLRYFGFLLVLVFGVGFIIRWISRDVISLDQLLGLTIGIITLIMAFFVKKYSKELNTNS
ncbi:MULTISPECIES: hypothetical protein [Bacillus]|uniref:Group-specific protein n=1 Tax=Bacillus mycoides TaxID=1405 RepID=A0AAP8GZ87_BACMY|nr:MULTISPECIES: hypothetical protein [Bacillus cereus group]PGW32373.1 hypothetical protein COE04_22170 [Bacillus cereus]EJR31274.1 hypothetical protein III_05500 [Bacillus mycoides]EJR93593.1 hypothetical protein IKM_05963 [Bacillus mycoides]EOO34022.1 hypothetical protein IKK_05811 [Bacillus mycoides]MCD4643189.1 hypothetical protein [Bacillus mycoides]